MMTLPPTLLICLFALITLMSPVYAARCYYEVLGIPKSASLRDIKQAFRKLALKLHPDKSDDPDAERKFVELGEAYEILSDPVQRLNYDEGRIKPGGSSGGHQQHHYQQSRNYNSDDFFGSFNEKEHFARHEKAVKEMMEKHRKMHEEFVRKTQEKHFSSFGNSAQGSHHDIHARAMREHQEMMAQHHKNIEQSRKLAEQQGQQQQHQPQQHHAQQHHQSGTNCKTTTIRNGNSVSKTTVCN